MKLVIVEWNDPCSTSEPVWQHRDQIDDLDAIPCITVGILLRENAKDLRVTLSLNPHAFSQAIIIPKSSIKRIRYLKIEEAP